ncbi:MAG: cholesterol catabolism transcriptional regulator KstR [Acidimicrobiales bacterium]
MAAPSETQAGAPTETLTRSQAARRGRVIDAAIELAAEGGYDAVQMRDVATRAQVALGTIYRYFSSKDELLAAALVQWAGKMELRLTQRPARGSTATERVVDVLRRASRALEENPLLTSALVTAIASPDPAVRECQTDVSAIMFALLSTALTDVEEERREGIMRVLSWVWFAALIGWVNGWSNSGTVGAELENAARLLLP